MFNFEDKWVNDSVLLAILLVIFQGVFISFLWILFPDTLNFAGKKISHRADMEDYIRFASAIFFAPFVENALIVMLFFIFKKIQISSLFILTVAVAAAAAHQPVGILRSTSAFMAFFLLAVQFTVMYNKHKVKIAYLGTVLTHSSYNAIIFIIYLFVNMLDV